jgi:hypothetical protein
MMVRTDTYLAKAAQYGCRVFIPIINQVRAAVIIVVDRVLTT